MEGNFECKKVGSIYSASMYLRQTTKIEIKKATLTMNRSQDRLWTHIKENFTVALINQKNSLTNISHRWCCNSINTTWYDTNKSFMRLNFAVLILKKCFSYQESFYCSGSLWWYLHENLFTMCNEAQYNMGFGFTPVKLSWWPLAN